MNELHRILKFLRSTWGLLSSATILFPGAAALFRISVAPENSVIRPYYVWAATVVAALALLLLTSYRDVLSLRNARRTAVAGAALAFVFFMTFTGLRVFALGGKRAEQSFFFPTSEARYVRKVTHDQGVIYYSQFPADLPRNELADNLRDEVTGDPLDLLSLASFILVVTSLTIGFGALGLFEYGLQLQPRKDLSTAREPHPGGVDPT